MRYWFCVAVCLLGTSLGFTDEVLTLTKEEQAVVDLTNAERKAAGLPALTPSKQLFDAARGHSVNMASQGKTDHTLNGKSPADRVKATGYQFGRTGENIAWNQRSANDVLKSWMNSAGHRANILNRDYTEIGIGIAYNSRGEPYWTQVFGKPR